MRKLVATFLIACALGASAASAQEFAYQDRSRTGTVALGGSIGFGLEPDTFLIAPHMDYFLFHHFALGPLIQMGVSDHVFALAPTLNFKGVFDIPAGGFARRVKPFVQGGVGFEYANADTARNVDDDDIDFMFNLGFGVDIYLTTHFSLGNNMMFNIAPAEVLGDVFWFTWQFVSARYHF